MTNVNIRCFFTFFFTFSIVFSKFVETLKHRLKKKKNKYVKLSFTSSKSTILTTSITSKLFRLFKFIQLSTTWFVNFVTFFESSFVSKTFLKYFNHRYQFLKRRIRLYCKLFLFYFLHSHICRVYRVKSFRFNRSIASFKNFTWRSIIFTSCFMRNHLKKAWILYKKEYFLRCLIKLVSSTILNSLY